MRGINKADKIIAFARLTANVWHGVQCQIWSLEKKYDESHIGWRCQRLKAVHFVKSPVNQTQKLTRRDTRAFAKQIATNAAAKPYQEIWKYARMLGMGSLRRTSSAIRPVAPLKHEDGSGTQMVLAFCCH